MKKKKKVIIFGLAVFGFTAVYGQGLLPDTHRMDSVMREVERIHSFHCWHQPLNQRVDEVSIMLRHQGGRAIDPHANKIPRLIPSPDKSVFSYMDNVKWIKDRRFDFADIFSDFLFGNTVVF